MAVERSMIDDALFITGAQRSGTTLLEKLLGAQDGVSLLSQPFPLLFVRAKAAFLESIHAGPRRYPLSHLFLESGYDAAALNDFLRQWRPERSELAGLFETMSAYSGQYTRFAPGQVDRALAQITPEDDFAMIVARLQHALQPQAGPRWVGSKEIMCEELVPALLDRGFRCAIILREPRDMVASLNHGRGIEFGGSPKPTWFNVRNWRKSVAYALAFAGHPRFHWCRYEDLVADWQRELARLSDALSLDLPSPLHFDVRDAAGAPWRGNSSHGELEGISDASINIHREVVDEGTAAAIEAACLPELQFLGYPTTMGLNDARQAIERFREPYTIARTGMDSDLAGAENARIEIERLERMADSPAPASIPWFLFEKVHARLRQTFRP